MKVGMERLTKLALRRAHSRVVTPVIVKASPGKLRELYEELKAFEFPVLERLVDRIKPIDFPFFSAKVIPEFNMLAMPLPREVIFSLAEDRRVEKIYSDELKFALAYPAVSREGVYTTTHRILRKSVAFTSTYWTKKLIGADVANAKGFTGRGVKVAVCDTGASMIHEQLSGRVKMMSVFLLQHLDTNGHGTWCCSCIAGKPGVDEWLSMEVGAEVKCEGMAPECELISIKCLGYLVGMGSDSDVIKAIAYALKEGADIISMSLGGPVQADSQDEDPYYDVMRAVTAIGKIPVVAAGNEGPNPKTISSPGWIEDVLTVGAYDPITGEIAPYSSRGPTVDGRVKPDVIAPGGGVPDHGIDSAIVNLLDKAGDGLPNRYSPIQGTSMATPHVAGLLACAEQAWRQLLGRDLTVSEVKKMMAELADHEKSNDAGWGLIRWEKFEAWLETQYGVRP